jgi:Ca-activated chloride channel family protein
MKDQTATAESGLLTAEGPIPLLGVTVEAQIRDYGARVVVSQRYRNDESQPIEAVYKFPLDEGAAVCGFEATIDGRHVVGRVEEREKAFADYDEALAWGHGAYLLDQERADVFTASVGNVPPGQEVVLRITTVAELAVEGDAIRFTLPTTVSPRYAPADDRRGVGIPEAERVSPPYALVVPYGLSLTVDVETSAPIRTVESPTHPTQVSIEGRRATVQLSAREAALDQDFVLKIAVADQNEPGALVERGPDGRTYALLSFRPKLEKKAAPSEVVFLIDRSGSMQGHSIEEAKNALELCLRSLRTGCLFNIVGFGSTHRALFPESRPYADDTLAAASRHVRSMEADMGGTEILPALELVLAARPHEGLPRQLFVLTDGQVSNTDAVIALVRRHAAHTRVFTFGIGAGASHHLVKGLARAGEGEAEFIAPGERIEAKVVRQLGRALAPALTDVRVDWGGLAVEQAPHQAPAVFSDGRVLLFGRLDALAATTVHLRANGPHGEVGFPLPLDPSSLREGTLVATLWARRAIRDLEEGASSLHPRRGSLQERAASLDERVKEEIIRLGTTHGLVSRYTSFVAVEKRETPVQGETVLRKVPVAITRGWHGLPGNLKVGGTGSYLVKMASAAPSSRMVLASPLEPYGPVSDGRAAASRAPRGPVVALRPLDRLIALQSADGSWDLTNALAQAIGQTKKDLDRRFAAAVGEPQATRTVTQRALDAIGGNHRLRRAFATALALTWLEAACGDSLDEWSALAAKAQDWLDRTPQGARFWREAAARPLPQS